MLEISLGQTDFAWQNKMNPGDAGRMQETRKDTQDESNKYLQFLEGVSLCLLVLWNHVVVGRMTARENPEQTHERRNHYT